MLTFGVVGTSRKENEKRRPLHPDHLPRIPEELRRCLIFEKGYGAVFGVSDAEMAALSGGIATRAELLADVGNVILPKPLVEDLDDLREAGTVWGWPHCVQQRAFTQRAVERRQTMIAFEEMFVWGPDGNAGRHTFYKNNELAGYCAVLHALQLRGIDGHYGDRRKVVILSFGAVSRGAIYALKARGFRDITICIQRPDHEVREEVLDCHYVRLCKADHETAGLIAVEHDGAKRPFVELLREADIIVNGIYQDPDCPLMFITDGDIPSLRKHCLIVDVSCDEGMGFPFARPTSFSEPLLRIGTLDYYAVDHTPSYLWESASRSISAALVVYLPTVLAGRHAWRGSDTIRRAVVIDNGVIQQRRILSFQDRKTTYPHELRGSGAASQND